MTPLTLQRIHGVVDPAAQVKHPLPNLWWVALALSTGQPLGVIIVDNQETLAAVFDALKPILDGIQRGQSLDAEVMAHPLYPERFADPLERQMVAHLPRLTLLSITDLQAAGLAIETQIVAFNTKTGEMKLEGREKL